MRACKKNLKTWTRLVNAKTLQPDQSVTAKIPQVDQAVTAQPPKVRRDRDIQDAQKQTRPGQLQHAAKAQVARPSQLKHTKADPDHDI